ncbi:hypothetical protein BD413DRAFT_697541 [Trametes elegans]|nr:hypothetical protein BD413DRAFT_697541 [Trametes elegans]
MVFALNRYVTLLYKIVLPISTFWWPNQTDRVRTPRLRIMIFYAGERLIVSICTGFADAYSAFSALRVFAMWNKDWKPFLLLLAIGLTVPVINIVMSIAIHSCASAADLLVLVLTWIKTYEIKQLSGTLRQNTSFSTLLLRDVTSNVQYCSRFFVFESCCKIRHRLLRVRYAR